MSLLPFKNNVKSGVPRGSVAYRKGELELPDRFGVAYGVEMRVSLTVNATAADAAGLSAAEQTAVLDAFSVDLRTNLSAAREQHPLQKESFTKLVDDAKRLLERDMVGRGSTTGLQKALAAGNNILTFTVFFSLNHAEFIDESAQFSGLGYEQLKDSELTVRLDSDPLPAGDANLRITDFEIDFRALTKDTYGSPAGPLVHVRKVNEAGKDTIETPKGMVLSVEDMNAALSATVITALRVKVGGRIVTDDPATPADIQAAYERAPDTGATEASLDDTRTPIFIVSDRPLVKMLVGEVIAKQITKNVDWDARVLYLPLLEDRDVRDMVRAAASHLEEGQFLHAVTTATVDGFKVEAEHLPYVGWRYFHSTQRAYHEFPGLRCAKGGQPYVWIPMARILSAAQRYRLALADTSGIGDPAANALNVLTETAASIPGAVTSTRGFPPEGAASPVFEEVRSIIVAAANELEAAQRAR